MKVLLSSIGSRGDIQPILALASEIQLLGHRARLCVAPNFKEWVESFGIECLSIGPDLRKLTGGATPRVPLAPSEEQRRQLAMRAVQTQFPILLEAARGCDLVVAAGALQFAARSVAETLQIPYAFAAYCPAVLPSSDHPPPKMGAHHPQSLPAVENIALWEEEERNWNDLFLDPLNQERAALGLGAVGSVHKHILTDHPWLAVDPVIAPAAATPDMGILQTGAWLLRDPHPLPAPLEEFLASGPPPLYFGFGSMRAAADTSRILVESARSVGARAVVSQGWGNLSLPDAGSDCILVDDVAHERLFPRIAAVVHHGGAGTTTAAARAGVPQVIVPHLYDQFYWAHRVKQLGIGTLGPARDALSVDRIISSLQECMKSETQERARSLAHKIQNHGARTAAEFLIRVYT